LLAPRLFTGFWEYQLGLVAAAALLLFILFREPASWLYRSPAPVPVLLLAAAALLPEAIVLAVSPTKRISDHFSLFIAALLFLFVFFNRKRAAPEAARSKAVPICCSAAAIIVLVVLSGSGFTHSRKAIAHFRNFYGTLSVILRGGGLHNAGLTLAHGRVAHGFQLQPPHTDIHRRLTTPSAADSTTHFNWHPPLHARSAAPPSISASLD
jgi:hypothetical protein